MQETLCGWMDHRKEYVQMSAQPIGLLLEVMGANHVEDRTALNVQVIICVYNAQILQYFLMDFVSKSALQLIILINRPKSANSKIFQNKNNKLKNKFHSNKLS